MDKFNTITCCGQIVCFVRPVLSGLLFFAFHPRLEHSGQFRCQTCDTADLDDASSPDIDLFRIAHARRSGGGETTKVILELIGTKQKGVQDFGIQFGNGLRCFVGRQSFPSLLVVSLAKIWITQHLVCFTDLLEFFLRLRLFGFVSHLVGVTGPSQSVISALDGGLIGPRAHIQDIIIVRFLHGGSSHDVGSRLFHFGLDLAQKIRVIHWDSP
mmetsp:Transcript_21058/g.48635  ORF Transcript_21058/g.48635 Transcript_21058/m.48635 type:complete len:213 (-) Transcript_21058:498-1136(-)